MAAAGRSPWLSHLVNLREQVEWAGGAPGRRHRPRRQPGRAPAWPGWSTTATSRPRSIEVTPDVLVVGGGPAGIAAALGLAGKDRRVLLVERAPALGGLAGRLDEIFPDLACASCFMEPALDDLLHHERIEVLTESRGPARCAARPGASRWSSPWRRGWSPRRPASAAASAPPPARWCCRIPGPPGLGTRQGDRPGLPGEPAAPLVDRRERLPAHLRAPHPPSGAPCQACADACPFGAIDLAAVATTRTIEVGAIVLATGLVPGEVPGGVAAAVPGLLSTYQLERLLHPSGPSAGALDHAGRRRAHLAPPRREGGRPEGDGELAIGSSSSWPTSSARSTRR